MSKFGDRLKLLRMERGFSQDQLASLAKLSRGSISNYESGIREPEYEVVEAFADIFNVDTDYLFGRSDVKRKVSSSPIFRTKKNARGKPLRGRFFVFGYTLRYTLAVRYTKIPHPSGQGVLFVHSRHGIFHRVIQPTVFAFYHQLPAPRFFVIIANC